MAEKVQLNLEHHLAELRDLQEKQIFTNAEISEIVKRRTQFELKVVGRTCTPNDFLRYAEYEQRLEKLRKLRASKSGRSSGPPSLSTYSIARHATRLLEMGTRRFPTSTLLWHALINHVQSLQPLSLKQVSKIFTSAIAASPHTNEYWLMAIKWTERHEDPAAARKLIMRSLRFLKKDWPIWENWIKMEIQFADNLNKRWKVLGINQQKTKGKGKAVEVDQTEEGQEIATTPALGQQAEDEEMDALNQEVDAVASERSLSDQAGVLNGQLVRLVLSHALSIFADDPTILQRLINLLQDSKSPLKPHLLNYLYQKIESDYPNSIQVDRLLAERFVTNAPTSGEERILAISKTIKTYQTSMKSNEKVAIPLLEFISKELRLTKDEALRTYLSANLNKINKLLDRKTSTLKQDPSFWLAYLDCASQLDLPLGPLADEMIRSCPSSEACWLRRCELAENDGLEHDMLLLLLKRALRSCPYSDSLWNQFLDQIERPWLDGSESDTSLAEAVDQSYIASMKQAQQLPLSLAPPAADGSKQTASILDLVLSRYIDFKERSSSVVDYDRIARDYAPSLSFWRSRIEADPTNLDALHRILSGQSTSTLADGLHRLQYLVWEKKDVKQASKVFGDLQGKFGKTQQRELEEGWQAILDHQPEQESSSEDEDAEME